MQRELLSIRRQALSQEVRAAGTFSPAESEEDLDGDLQRAGFGPTQEEEEGEARTEEEALGDAVAAPTRDATNMLIDALYSCAADMRLPLTNNPARISHHELQG